jgi:hypothetical protein
LSSKNCTKSPVTWVRFPAGEYSFYFLPFTRIAGRIRFMKAFIDVELELLDYSGPIHSSSHYCTSRPLGQSSVLGCSHGRDSSDVFKCFMHQFPCQSRTFGISIAAHLLGNTVCLSTIQPGARAWGDWDIPPMDPPCSPPPGPSNPASTPGASPESYPPSYNADTPSYASCFAHPPSSPDH